MLNNILVDLNVRLNEVDSTDTITITNSFAIKQALIKLLNVQIGSIPYFRAYGVDIKQFLQYPLSESTGTEAYEHIKNQIEQFIKTVTILDNMSSITIDYDAVTIEIVIAVMNNQTGEVIILPAISIPVTN